jgi:D-sedoheptulose 7-phosphate isomerase
MPSHASSSILSEIEESIAVHKELKNASSAIEASAAMLLRAYRNGGKMVIFGNGGSAADAQHIAGELVGKFKLERKALPAVALTVNSSIVTAIANDYSYDMVFARQVEAQCVRGDVAIGISTSGKSRNVIKAFEKARETGVGTIGLTGENGFPAGSVDVEVRVPSSSTQRIQECHILIGHILSGMVEEGIFGKK